MMMASPVRSSTVLTRHPTFKPVAALALLGCLAVVGSTSAFAQHAADQVPHNASAVKAAESDDIVAHVSDMLRYAQGDVRVSDVQKTKLSAIIQQANADIGPLQEKLRDSHAKMFSLLTQPTIDRSAVEAAGKVQMDTAVQISKRSTQFVIQVAEVLTPEQRKAIAEHIPHHDS